MKVLQTLGRSRNTQEGIFQYRRDSNGILIDSTVGQANLSPTSVFISNEEWSLILRGIEDTEYRSFRIVDSDSQNPPNISIYEIVGRVRDDLHRSYRSYIAAILEHEGSVDLYHGPLGRDHTATICLKRDIGE